MQRNICQWCFREIERQDKVITARLYNEHRDMEIIVHFHVKCYVDYRTFHQNDYQQDDGV